VNKIKFHESLRHKILTIVYRTDPIPAIDSMLPQVAGGP